MARDEADKALSDLAWSHISAEEYDHAETAVRRRLAIADPQDYQLRWELFGLLASILNSLSRPAEANEMLRESFVCAQKVGPMYDGIAMSRYMIANQALIYGDPADALVEVGAIPAGQGHIESLLHSVAAQALWKLNRIDESRLAAHAAIATSPTNEDRADLAIVLEHILGRTDL